MTSPLSKLAADNITNTTNPPNEVEEAKDRSSKLSRYILSVEMKVETMTHIEHSRIVWPRDVSWSESWKRMFNYLLSEPFIAIGLVFSYSMRFYLLNTFIVCKLWLKPCYL